MKKKIKKTKKRGVEWKTVGIGAALGIFIVLITILFTNCGTGGSMLAKQIPGSQGITGDTGSQGIQGVPGVDGQDGAPGVDGTDGVDGQDGQDGADGSSCTTFSAPGGAVIQCTDGTSSIVSDGQPGSMIEILNPCNDLGQHDEIFLKFTDSNGTMTVVAFFTENGNAMFSRLTVLRCDGQTEYITTDRQDCRFKLDSECNLLY